ncbi:MAG: hypothetical protein QOH06_5705 [Acidobacteriota bacterium]|jgi:hypothetical protein|nr:hypothetical protein [Acidobacteriota bacterium]
MKRPFRTAIPCALFLASAAATAQIEVVAIVNQDHYTVTQQEIAQTVALASQSLSAATGKTYSLKQVVFGHFGAQDATKTMHDYVKGHFNDPPDYVIVFHKDGNSVTAGGYMLTPFGTTREQLALQLQKSPKYCNPAGSPYMPPGVIYGAALDWHPLIGKCGYELQGLKWVHVNAKSFGGQCVNQSGLTCVFQFGEWQCPNLIDDPVFGPQIADRKLLTAFSINHELLHPFGFKGNADHACAASVPQSVKDKSAFNMCGTNVIALKNAKARCVADKRPLGTVCTHKNQCNNSFCYEFGPPIANACSHTCNTAADCAAVPGKVATCRKRRLDIPTTDNSCFYVPGPL